jgi:hypothetical protein
MGRVTAHDNVDRVAHLVLIFSIWYSRMFLFVCYCCCCWCACVVAESPPASRQKSSRKNRAGVAQQQTTTAAAVGAEARDKEKDKRERERAREIEREMEREREKAREKEISSFREFSTKLPMRRRNKHSSFGPDDPAPDPSQYSLTPLHYEAHAMAAAASEQQVRQSLRQMPPIASHQHVNAGSGPGGMHAPRDNRSREGHRLRGPRPVAPLGGGEPHPPYSVGVPSDLPPSRGGSKGPPSLTPRAQALIGIDPLAGPPMNGGIFGGGAAMQAPAGMKYVSSSGVMGGMAMVPDDSKGVGGHKALPHISHHSMGGGVASGGQGGYQMHYHENGFPNEESKMGMGGGHPNMYQQHDSSGQHQALGAPQHFAGNFGDGGAGSYSSSGSGGGGSGSGKHGKYPPTIGKMS